MSSSSSSSMLSPSVIAPAPGPAYFDSNRHVPYEPRQNTRAVGRLDQTRAQNQARAQSVDVVACDCIAALLSLLPSKRRLLVPVAMNRHINIHYLHLARPLPSSFLFRSSFLFAAL